MTDCMQMGGIQITFALKTLNKNDETKVNRNTFSCQDILSQLRFRRTSLEFRDRSWKKCINTRHRDKFQIAIEISLNVLCGNCQYCSTLPAPPPDCFQTCNLQIHILSRTHRHTCRQLTLHKNPVAEPSTVTPKIPNFKRTYVKGLQSPLLSVVHKSVNREQHATQVNWNVMSLAEPRSNGVHQLRSQLRGVRFP